MIFYLGTHLPTWLKTMDIPLFISRRTIYKRKTFPRALGRWALDSGGFSELSMYGTWRTSARQYAKEVETFSREIGNLDFAAVQDWMCESFILKKTGLTVEKHQMNTVDSFNRLRDLSPQSPWIPILQGFDKHEYLQHIEMYTKQNIDLTSFSVVGIGSICRRQHTKDAEDIIRTISKLGIRLHGFGFKKIGLRNVASCLQSADSLAWSFAGRRSPPLPGHTHKNCANCVDFALNWRDELIKILGDQNEI